jgi:hypothetical protein
MSSSNVTGTASDALRDDGAASLGASASPSSSPSGSSAKEAAAPTASSATLAAAADDDPRIAAALTHLTPEERARVWAVGAAPGPLVLLQVRGAQR